MWEVFSSLSIWCAVLIYTLFAAFFFSVTAGVLLAIWLRGHSRPDDAGTTLLGLILGVSIFACLMLILLIANAVAG